MKKLLLLAAFGLMASPAFAQSSTATVTSSGTDNDADITQSGGASNTAIIDQVNTLRGDADIVQKANDVTGNGGGNYAKIEQIENNGDDNMMSAITQEGAGNRAESQASREDASLVQTQIGDNNEADIIGGNSANWGRNINQYQEGNFNDAYAEVSGNADVDQDQIGDNNNANVTGMMQASTTIQYQEGDWNEATLTGTQRFVTVSQDQIGDYNDSFITDLEGSGSSGSTYQSGDYNEITVDYIGGAKDNGFTLVQNGNAGGVLADGNVIDVNFTTDGNTATATQIGTGNSATIDQ